LLARNTEILGIDGKERKKCFMRKKSATCDLNQTRKASDIRNEEIKLERGRGIFWVSENTLGQLNKRLMQI
jgi:hypothetical protein